MDGLQWEKFMKMDDLGVPPIFGNPHMLWWAFTNIWMWDSLPLASCFDQEKGVPLRTATEVTNKTHRFQLKKIVVQSTMTQLLVFVTTDQHWSATNGFLIKVLDSVTPVFHVNTAACIHFIWRCIACPFWTVCWVENYSNPLAVSCLYSSYIRGVCQSRKTIILPGGGFKGSNLGQCLCC